MKNLRFPLFSPVVTGREHPPFDMCLRAVLIASMLMVAGNAPALAQQDPTQAELDALEGKRDATTSVTLKPLADLTARYRESLEKRKAATQTAGDLDGVLAVDNEIAGIAKDNDQTPLPKDPELARLRKTYREQKSKISEQVTPRLLEIERQYAAGLEKLVAELTKAGKLDEAKRVRDLKDAFVEEFKERKESLATRTFTEQQSAGDHKAGDEQEFKITQTVRVPFCWIPPGEFVMGSPAGELGRKGNENPHSVKLTQGFWMAKTEVTQAQWQSVMGSLPDELNKRLWGKNNPVGQVSWLDICGTPERTGGFLGKVNSLAPRGWRFDLPTEAQREYACRAGTTTALHNDKELTDADGECRHLDEVAWYNKNCQTVIHPAGHKKPNAWGLVDMHGNVAEWCADWATPYATKSAIDPTGPESGSARVIRGGGVWGPARHLRSAARDFSAPDAKSPFVGFRLILRALPDQ